MSTYDKNNVNLQIRKLPYSIIQQLVKFLDGPDKTMNWKALIGAMPDGTYTQIQVWGKLPYRYIIYSHVYIGEFRAILVVQ